MSDCTPATCPHILDLQHALEVTEAALTASQERCDKLAQQVARLRLLAGGEDEGATVADLAARYRVEHNTIHQWRYRYSDFPKPVIIVGQSPLYDRRQIDAWVERHPLLRANHR